MEDASDVETVEAKQITFEELEGIPDLQPSQNDVESDIYAGEELKESALHSAMLEQRPTGTRSHLFPSDARRKIQWKARFRRVLERYNAPDDSEKGQPVFLDHHYRQIHAMLYSRGPKEEDLRLAWLSLDPVKRSRLWPQLMITTMDRFPESILAVLSATYVEPYPAWYAVADTLKLLAKVALRDKPSVPEELFELIDRLYDTAGSTRAMLPDSVVWHVLEKSTFEQGLQWIKSFDTRVIRVGPQSLLMFAAFFGSRGEYKLALSLLRRAKNEGASTSSQIFSNVGNKILRASMLSPGGYHANSDILRELMEIGVHIQIDSYNALMLNAVEAKDLQTALQIHDLIMAHKLEPDDIHWTIFLQGIKLSDDATLVSRAIDVASEAARTNNIIANQIIHLTALYHY
ncbi:hypothetical protein LTS18_007485, partial [Coniosporium uncinatum]